MALTPFGSFTIDWTAKATKISGQAANFKTWLNTRGEDIKTFINDTLIPELDILFTALTAHYADYIRQPGFGTTAGSANTYTLTLSPALAAYADGVGIAIKMNAANTGASTINVNSLGAKSLVDSNGDAFASGALKQNYIYTFKYSATTGNFIQQGKGVDALTGDAAVGDVLVTKTFYKDDAKTKLTGTMTNRGAVTYTPGTTDQTVAAGYHNGSGKVSGDADLIAGNIKSGVDIFGVTGNCAPRLHASGTGTLSAGVASVTGIGFTPSAVIISCFDALFYEWDKTYHTVGNGAYGPLSEYTRRNNGVTNSGAWTIGDGSFSTTLQTTDPSLTFYWEAWA